MCTYVPMILCGKNFMTALKLRKGKIVADHIES
jgi:hypothetical protein